MALRFCLWSSRLVWNVRSILYLLMVILWFLFVFSKVSLLLGLLLEFIFSEITRLNLPSPASWFNTNLFLWFKLSSGFIWCSGSRWLFRIESNFNKFMESQVWTVWEGNKLKKVIKVLIRKDTIINALKLAVQIDGSFKCSDFWSISICTNEPSYFNLSLLVSIQHTE